MGKGGVGYWRKRANSNQMEEIPVSEWPQELLEAAGITQSWRGIGGSGGSVNVTVTKPPENLDELAAIAGDAARELEFRIGPGATVIVLVAFERNGHSYPAFAWGGACLPTIGLLDVGANMVRDSMPEEYR